MSASEQFQSKETRRGGCADAIVMALTFRRFGIETTVDPSTIISEDRFSINEDGEQILVDDSRSITNRVITTGDTVIFNAGVDDSPKVTRRIVRNRSNE